MSRKICLLAVIVVAAAVGLTPAANAQCSAAFPSCVHYIGAGSSAMWQGFALVAYNDMIVGKNLTAAGSAVCPAGHACTGNHWDLSNGASCVDTRNAAITTNQTGNVWVDWVEDTTVGAPTAVWAYINLDSTVGNRCFLARNGGAADTIAVPAADVGAADSALITNTLFSGNTPPTPLTADVQTALNGLPITAGMTDIRPEDALFATLRILGDGNQCGGTVNNNTDTFPANSPATNCFFSFALGYDLAAAGGNGLGNGVGGNITDASGSKAQPVMFALPGYNDPFTGNAVPTTIRVFPVGESPIVFAVNRSNANGFGQIIGSYAATQLGNCYGAGLTGCTTTTNGGANANTGTPSGSLANEYAISATTMNGAGVPYTSDGSYYVRNLWDQHPWPMVNNINPPLAGNAALGAAFGYDAYGNGLCPAGAQGICQVARRPLAALFSGSDCEGDAFAFTWPLSPGVTQGLRAQIPNRQDFPITLYLREPLSGTYNTTEYSVIRRFGTPGGIMGSSDAALPAPFGPTLAYPLENPYPAGTTFERMVYLSQETNVDPTVAAGNPLNFQCPASAASAGFAGDQGVRLRGIGTGHVINGSGAVLGVKGQQDSLAYTFFGFGNVSKLAASKSYGYLMVDAIDPIFDNYENVTGNAGHSFANGTGYAAPWGNGSGTGFNVEGEPACQGSGTTSIGCPFSLAYPATQEPGQPANNGAGNYAAIAPLNATSWGVLPACGAAGQPACNAAAIWHTAKFGLDDSKYCPDGQPCTYPHLRDGSYPAWSELRLECDTAAANCSISSDALGAEALIQNLQQDIHFSKSFGVPDFLPMDDSNPADPYGDVYFIRDHFAYTSMDDANINNTTSESITSHNAENAPGVGAGMQVTLSYGPTADCPNGNVPINGPPTKECGGDAGGYVRAARPENYNAFFSNGTPAGTTGAYAAGSGTDHFNQPGDLQ